MSKIIKKINSLINSLKTRMMLLIAIVAIIVFALVIYYTSYNLNTQLNAFVYEDLAMKNKVYVSEISAIFRDRATVIKAVRDDLERYDTRGQMWIHLAAHTGESVFYDADNGEIYKESFQKKLNLYYKNGQLSGDKLTKQIKLMIEQISKGNRKNSYGDGMKFFYIGIKSLNKDKIIQGYDEYQDSSLWVPDDRVDSPYNPLIRPWYVAGQKAGRDRVVFTEPYAEKRTREALVSGGITISVEGKQGTLAGGISIKPIMEQIQILDKTDDQLSIFSRGIDKDVVYVKSDPKYIYSSRDESLGEQFKEYNDEEVIKDPINKDLMDFYDYCKDKEHGVEEWTIGGEERLIAFQTIPELGWKVFNSVSKEKTLRNVAISQMNNSFLSAFGLIILLILIYISISQSIKPIEVIKEDLIEISETGDLSKRITVMGKDEIGQIANSINQMLDNTAMPVQELGKKVKLIARGSLNTEIDIDARGDIAELISSFDDMTKQLKIFEKKHKETSPLTGLQGGISIEEEVKKRIENNEDFAICLIDADNFKPFNDFYGYSKGNTVIKYIAELTKDAINSYGSDNDFIGHIGGDDFVIICKPNEYKNICDYIITQFDNNILNYYNKSDFKAGYIYSKDRDDNIKKYSVMTLTIAVLKSHIIEGANFLEIGEELAKLKSEGKKLEGSSIVTN